MNNLGKTLSELYFHELEVRDKIFVRLQLNYAIYASGIAVLAYMLRMADFASPCVILTLFYVGMVTSLALIGISAYMTWSSLTGYRYLTLPKSKEIISYGEALRNRSEELLQYNVNYQQSIPVPDPDWKLDSYLHEVMSRCIDHNNDLNEARRLLVRKSMLFIFYAAIPFFSSSVLFVVYDLDASSPRKVAASYVESSPLIKELKKTEKSIFEINNLLNQERELQMPDKIENNVQPSAPPPPPPPEPKKPEPQYSTEDYKAPMPDKSKLLNEGK